MRLSPKAKKNQQEDNAFYIHLGKKLRQARRTKVNEFTGKETIVPQTKVANALKTTFQQIRKYEKGEYIMFAADIKKRVAPDFLSIVEDVR